MKCLGIHSTQLAVLDDHQSFPNQYNMQNKNVYHEYLVVRASRYTSCVTQEVVEAIRNYVA